MQELGLECLHLCPEGGPLSHVTLALATACMNSRIRSSGLSAVEISEIWTLRDQFMGAQLAIFDFHLIRQQHLNREQNHPYSAKSKAQSKQDGTTCDINVGDLHVGRKG